MSTVLSRPLLSSDEVCRRARVSYRQLDYLIRTGVVTPAQGARGSGSQRRYTDRDLLAVWVAGELGRRGARWDVKLAGVQALLACENPWEAGVLVVHHARSARVVGRAELAAIASDVGALVELLGAGWTIGLPPRGLDTSPSLW